MAIIIQGNFGNKDKDSSESFQDRMERIRESLNSISKLMSELDKIKEKQQARKEK